MGIFDTLKEAISEGTKSIASEIERQISHAFLRRFHKVKQQIMRELLSLLIILISITLLSVSAVFFLIEYLHLTKTISFLIIGIIVLIIGILIKLT